METPRQLALSQAEISDALTQKVQDLATTVAIERSKYKAECIKSKDFSESLLAMQQ